MIDSVSVTQIISGLMLCWILGFGVGKAVAWTRKIADVV